MRQLLTMHSEPGTRPASAFFISNSRPGTAAAAVPHRPNSSELLSPRQRPMSASGRTVGFIGPYISDASRLPFSRSV